VLRPRQPAETRQGGSRKGMRPWWQPTGRKVSSFLLEISVEGFLLDECTIQAYRATDYRVHADEPFTLRIDKARRMRRISGSFAGCNCCLYHCLESIQPTTIERRSGHPNQASSRWASAETKRSILHRNTSRTPSYGSSAENRRSSCSPLSNKNSPAAFEYQLVRRGSLPKALKRG
jgi:hypothetical protein